jgi:hypothetical protein
MTLRIDLTTLELVVWYGVEGDCAEVERKVVGEGREGREMGGWQRVGQKEMSRVYDGADDG